MKRPLQLSFCLGCAIFASIGRPVHSFSGGFSLSELPEEVFDEEGLEDTPSTLPGLPSTLSQVATPINLGFQNDNNINNKKSSVSAKNDDAKRRKQEQLQRRQNAYADKNQMMEEGTGGGGGGGAVWEAIQRGGMKALVPSLVTVITGAAVTTISRKLGPTFKRMVAQRKNRRMLQEIERKERMMMEGVGSSSSAAESKGRKTSSPTNYLSDLEDQVEGLKAEVVDQADQLSRLQTSKIEELNNARNVVEQLRKELDTVRSSKEHLREQLDTLKRDYQLRTQSMQYEASKKKSITEEGTRRIRAAVEAEITEKYQQLLNKEREALKREMRHETASEAKEQVKVEKEKYEAEIVALYKRRLAEEVAKRESALEDRLRAQDADYRRQCEELRSKVQTLLRDRQDTLKEKVALHAREWQEKLVSTTDLNQNNHNLGPSSSRQHYQAAAAPQTQGVDPRYQPSRYQQRQAQAPPSQRQSRHLYRQSEMEESPDDLSDSADMMMRNTAARGRRAYSRKA